ncbi:MAG: hypothetical protein K6C38_09390 [Saccharofermentans sp.]|jgi:hypothetical protein|nr:hypothetical protein [Saccharofermentans sp.]
MDKRNNKKLWAYIAVGALIILITVFSIQWTGANKPLGNEKTVRIYQYDTFDLLFAAIVNGDAYVSLNPDKHYVDEFDFVYDKASSAYTISKLIGDETYYLCMTQDHEISLTDSADSYGTRWNVRRSGNSMYYFLINSEDGYALTWTGVYNVGMMPFDENDTRMYMRLQ